MITSDNYGHRWGRKRRVLRAFIPVKNCIDVAQYNASVTSGFSTWPQWSCGCLRTLFRAQECVSNSFSAGTRT